MSNYGLPIDKQLPNERCNYITKNIILGACPTAITLQQIENFGVDIFIDLREQTNYSTQKKKYHFPITCGKPPSKHQADAILQIVNDNPDKLFYIHCNGGHGRAGTIGSYLMGKLYELDVTDAVSHIEKCRNTRIDKTRNFIPTPEMPAQIKFLVKELGIKSKHIIPNRADTSWVSLLQT